MKKAFRKKIRQVHPDAGAELNSYLKGIKGLEHTSPGGSAEGFRKVQEAYKALPQSVSLWETLAFV